MVVKNVLASIINQSNYTYNATFSRERCQLSTGLCKKGLSQYWHKKPTQQIRCPPVHGIKNWWMGFWCDVYSQKGEPEVCASTNSLPCSVSLPFLPLSFSPILLFSLLSPIPSHSPLWSLPDSVGYRFTCEGQFIQWLVMSEVNFISTSQ